MSSSRVGKLLTGTVLAAALTISLPGSSEAAGHGSAAQPGDVWGLVVSWFSDLWDGSFRDMTARPSGFSSALDNASATGTPSEPALSTTTCKGDQGVCIDPNG